MNYIVYFFVFKVYGYEMICGTRCVLIKYFKMVVCDQLCCYRWWVVEWLCFVILI